jgi:glycosyltransferase involved in cell wall biosynthesis
VRVAILTPFDFPSVRGNAITANRIARGLSARGVELSVWDLSATPKGQVAVGLQQFRPTLIHAFHTYRVGPFALDFCRSLGLPLVVTVTGTDANHDLFDPSRAAAVRSVLGGASSVTAFHDSMRAKLLQALPWLEAKIVVISQSVDLRSGESFPLASRVALPLDPTLFLFPAGTRRVKNPRFPLVPLDDLAARHPGLRLLYAGPLLDPGESEALLSELETRPWALHLGEVPHSQMRSLIEAVDVAINCSVSEGGMANSLLEAMFLGRPVLASDIDGNRSLVEDGVNGFLFSTPREFGEKAERLLVDRALRSRMGQAGKAKVLALYPSHREIDAYLNLYLKLVPAACESIF